MELDGPQFKHRCDDLNRLGFVERLHSLYTPAHAKSISLRFASFNFDSHIGRLP